MRASTFLCCLLAAELALGCDRSETAAPAPSKSAIASAAVSSPSASERPAQPARPQHPAERVVTTWSSALDRHDLEALKAVYAPQVRLHGARKSLAEVVGAKRNAFKQDPNYRQRLGKVRIQASPRGYVVRFEKQSGSDFASVTEARLVLEAKDEALLIVEESDAAEDKRFKKVPPSSCYEAVSGVVASLPAIQDDIRKTSRSHPRANPSAIFYTEEPDKLDAAQGYFHPERFEPRWRIELAAGELTIRDAATAELLAVSEDQKASVRAACSAPADAGPAKAR